MRGEDHLKRKPERTPRGYCGGLSLLLCPARQNPQVSVFSSSWDNMAGMAFLGLLLLDRTLTRAFWGGKLSGKTLRNFYINENRVA